jgi:hypothetical protein
MFVLGIAVNCTSLGARAAFFAFANSVDAAAGNNKV